MRKVITVMVGLLVLATVVYAGNTVSEWNGKDGIGDILIFRNTGFSDDESIWDYAPQLEALDPSVGYTKMDDFLAHFDTLFTWQIEADDVGGTHAPIDSAGGVLKLVTDGDDNDEVYVYELYDQWKMQTDKPLWVEARIMSFAVDSTYADNLVFGLTDDAVGGGDVVADDGAGPPSNYSGALFYVADAVAGVGGTTWNTETSSTTTQETNAGVSTRTAGSFTDLGILYNGDGKVFFYIDGSLKATHSTTVPATNMTIVCGVKTGAAVDTRLYIDYIKAMQVR